MSVANTRSIPATASAIVAPDGRSRARQGETAGLAAFLAAMTPVLVEDTSRFSYAGCLGREEGTALWTWLAREVSPQLAERLETTGGSDAPGPALDAIVPQLLLKLRDALNAAKGDHAAERKITLQLGGDDVRQRLPVLVSLIKNRPLMDRAAGLGKLLNSLSDDSALASALQSVPTKDSMAFALLMHVAMAHIVAPNRLIRAAARLAGGAGEQAIRDAELAPVVEAALAHAQNQLAFCKDQGAFSDIDLMCRAVERFHRLMRAVGSFVEPVKKGPWAVTLSDLTLDMSNRIEPRLREVTGNINQALRRGRDGHDHADPEQLLSALNGAYLLQAVRDARDSLAVNAAFDQVWSETGKALEVLLARNLDVLRENPADPMAAARLDTGIKIAEIRFNPEYAEIMRKARQSAERRTAAAS